MNDADIIKLYWARNERAIAESKARYGGYCLSIAWNILGDPQDAEEAASDTWLAAWNSIPPHRPAILRSYLGKLTRRISLKRWRDRNALKRGGGETPLVLDELADCLAGEADVECEADAKRVAETVNCFLAALKEGERGVFICRYWYLDSIQEIAGRFGYSESRVKSLLLRLRKRLREQLRKEGYFADK